jgi:hypothetical protein
MALAKKCDICGGFYEAYNCNDDPDNPSGIMLVNVCKDDTYFSNDVIDCCPGCMKVICDTIDNLIKPDEPMEE